MARCSTPRNFWNFSAIAGLSLLMLLSSSLFLLQ